MIRATFLFTFGVGAGVVLFVGVVAAIWIEAVKIYNGHEE